MNRCFGSENRIPPRVNRLQQILQTDLHAAFDHPTTRQSMPIPTSAWWAGLGLERAPNDIGPGEQWSGRKQTFGSFMTKLAPRCSCSSCFFKSWLEVLLSPPLLLLSESEAELELLLCGWTTGCGAG